MAKFIVKHGNVKMGTERVGIGAVVEMSEKEAKEVDADGVFLCTPESWAKMQAKAKLDAELQAGKK